MYRKGKFYYNFGGDYERYRVDCKPLYRRIMMNREYSNDENMQNNKVKLTANNKDEIKEIMDIVPEIKEFCSDEIGNSLTSWSKLPGKENTPCKKLYHEILKICFNPVFPQSHKPLKYSLQDVFISHSNNNKENLLTSLGFKSDRFDYLSILIILEISKKDLRNKYVGVEFT